MKKITALTLSLILVLSSTSAFAAERFYTDFNINNFFGNYGFYNYEPTYENDNVETTSGNVETANAYAEETADVSKKNEAYAASRDEVPAENEAAAPADNKAAAPAQKRAATAKTETTSTSAPSSSNYERRVVELVNIERQKNGLSPLTLDSAISNVARIKSKDMSDNNYFAHHSPTYGSAGDMLTQFGIKYSAWGENIAAGQRTPEDVVNGWMNSEGHKANILSSDFSKIGVGYVNNGRPHWTQIFTN